MTIPPALVAFSAIGVLIQTAIPPELVSPAERLTLVAVLLVAVKVLWTSNSKKDDAMMAMAQKVTETMTLTAESNREVRKSTEELGSALDNLASNIAAMPCAMMPKPEPQTPPAIIPPRV